VYRLFKRKTTLLVKTKTKGRGEYLKINLKVENKKRSINKGNGKEFL